MRRIFLWLTAAILMALATGVSLLLAITGMGMVQAEMQQAAPETAATLDRWFFRLGERMAQHAETL
jgi:hypothetical protein